MVDYTEIALESLLCESAMWRSVTVNRLVAESEFILGSLESGCIIDPVQEAVLKETAEKAIAALKMFLNSINAKFKEKVAHYYERYIPWVTENAERIKEAATKSSVTLAPYWKGKIDKDKQQLTNLPSNAFKVPYNADDVSFATNILPSIKTVADLEDTAKLSNILKNKYRFGVEEADNSKIKKEELKESALAQQVDSMIKYVQNYKSISDALSSISKQWETSATNFEKNVTESAGILTKDMFLLIETSGLYSTDLALLKRFDQLPDTIMEAEDGENTSLTTVTSDTANGNAANGGEEKKVKGDSQSRYRLADKFARLAFSAFMTACEERFIVYIKVMSQILGESPKGKKEEKKEKK